MVPTHKPTGWIQKKRIGGPCLVEIDRAEADARESTVSASDDRLIVLADVLDAKLANSCTRWVGHRRPRCGIGCLPMNDRGISV